MKVFYHNDLDGRCSAHWYNKILSNEDCEFIEIDYINSFPFDLIYPDEKIYILDFSIKPKDMLKLLEITKNIVWIDHHKSVIEEYKDFNYNIDGIRYYNEERPLSASVLTYLYLKKQDLNFNDLETAPFFLLLINDWDTWQHKYPDTKAFVLGCHLYDTHPKSNFWVDLDNCRTVLKVIKDGYICNKYQEHWSREFVNTFGFETYLDEYKCFAVNLGKCNLDYFKSIYQNSDNYDMYVAFCFDGKKWKVSLYSTKIDVSVVAKKYGGGGHNGAGGFVCDHLPFKMENRN